MCTRASTLSEDNKNTNYCVCKAKSFKTILQMIQRLCNITPIDSIFMAVTADQNFDQLFSVFYS